MDPTARCNSRLHYSPGTEPDWRTDNHVMLHTDIEQAVDQ